MTLSPQQQQQPEQLGGSGTGSARLDSGSCGRVQRLLVSDLTQAAAHLGIHVTQPFAPAACELEPDQVAAAAGQQGAAQAGGGAAARVVSAVSVCGRVQEGPAASSALALHLQEAAARYYAAAELAEQDLYTCPPASECGRGKGRAKCMYVPLRFCCICGDMQYRVVQHVPSAATLLL